MLFRSVVRGGAAAACARTTGRTTPELEDAATLEEEVALLGKEHFVALVDRDLRLVRLDLAEVRIDRRVDGEGVAQHQLGVEALQHHLGRIAILALLAWNLASHWGLDADSRRDALRRAQIETLYANAARQAARAAKDWGDADRIRAELGWTPCSSDLDTIVATAWELRAGETLWTAMPLFHLSAAPSVLAPMLVGGTTVLAQAAE